MNRVVSSFFMAVLSLAVAGVVAAQPTPAPTSPTSPPEDDEEVVVDVTTAVNQLPILLIVPLTEADRALSDEVRKQVELTGLFTTPSAESVGISSGIPDRQKWPGLALGAAVVTREVRAAPMFPAIRSSTYLRGIRDEVRRRELTEYPGTSAMTAPVLADAIVEDVLGIRSHMSGRLLITDSSTHGERSVRLLSPDGQRGRRITGFGSLARGADFGEDRVVYYAAEDPSGRLALYREGSATSLHVGVSNYIQGVSYSPDSRHIALSAGLGSSVRTWTGPSLDKLSLVDVGSDQISLSPSVNSAGEVVHAVGGEHGPFSIFLGTRRVTPPGIWAAMPVFCPLGSDKRIAYMARAGLHWEVRIMSLSTGASRTVANGMSPACSPDGRTIAYYAPAKGSGKQGGVYLTSDQGGVPHRVWGGQVAGLRWAAGEPLPPRMVEAVAPVSPAASPAASSTSPAQL